jgi:hypothetical protein
MHIFPWVEMVRSVWPGADYPEGCEYQQLRDKQEA